MNDLIVTRRFCGPPDSGNGGWTAGALATQLAAGYVEDHAEPWPAIEVTLRQPPPLDTPMTLDIEGGSVTATYDGSVVASATVLERDVLDVAAVAADVARGAEAESPALTTHPFPTCFVCGTARDEGDGLRIFPGRVADEPRRMAATWTPHPSTAEDLHSYGDSPRASVANTWAALDCVSGWSGPLVDRLSVLGRMTARLDTLPVIGEEHVVVGESRSVEGRKSFTAATVYDAAGRIVGSAEHVWIEVEAAPFGASQEGQS